jgi:hypothetical protein
MTRTEVATEYVCTHARYVPDSPNNPYRVRWPTPYSRTLFLSKDTHDLVQQLAKYIRKMERAA